MNEWEECVGRRWSETKMKKTTGEMKKKMKKKGRAWVPRESLSNCWTGSGEK